LKKESTEQIEYRLRAKKAALKARSKSMNPREESTMLRARKANLKETRSGLRVRPPKNFSSDKDDPYANPNE
jgi:hypothetical protein